MDQKWLISSTLYNSIIMLYRTLIMVKSSNLLVLNSLEKYTMIVMIKLTYNCNDEMRLLTTSNAQCYMRALLTRGGGEGGPHFKIWMGRSDFKIWGIGG